VLERSPLHEPGARPSIDRPAVPRLQRSQTAQLAGTNAASRIRRAVSLEFERYSANQDLRLILQPGLYELLAGSANGGRSLADEIRLESRQWKNAGIRYVDFHRKAARSCLGLGLGHRPHAAKTKARMRQRARRRHSMRYAAGGSRFLMV